jgi:hypothetical protein
MDIQWKELPELLETKDIDEYTRITRGGNPILDIAIIIRNHETGAVRFGSQNGVEAFARRNGDKIYLQIGKHYAEIPGNTATPEIIAALTNRLAEVIPTEKWGVEMRSFVVEVPKGMFVGV